MKSIEKLAEEKSFDELAGILLSNSESTGPLCCECFGVSTGKELSELWGTTNPGQSSLPEYGS